MVVSAALVIGLVAALAAGRVLRSLLYQTSPTDTAVFVAVPVLLATVALVASLLPARSAARIDPNEAVRADT
jgi:ABC-type antimicrobial peptide transport system permease subunit